MSLRRACNASRLRCRKRGALGIRALAIAPSLFHTGITKSILDEFANELTKDAAFPKRMGRPEE